MEKRLYDAAVEGNVICLINLLRDDPLIIDKCMVGSFVDTPLHIAAMLGHLDFSLELLTRKPELAGELNSRNASPLHLASAKGYVEVVKALVEVNLDACLTCDRDGRNPVHVAASKGRLDVLRVLIGARRDAARARINHDKTILHLCVESNRFEPLKFLVETFLSDKEFLNSMDNSGNNILHIAVAEKQIQMVAFLLTGNVIEVNALSGHGLTSMDILAHTIRDEKHFEVKNLLESAGGSRSQNALRVIKASDLPSKKFHDEEKHIKRISPYSKQKKFWANYFTKQEDWLEKQKQSLMITAALIANMAFQVGISPPGGVWQDDTTDQRNSTLKPHLAGTSVFASRVYDTYFLFLCFNTIGFMASLSIILLLVSGLPLRKRIFLWLLMAIMWIAISCTTLVYVLSISATFPDDFFDNKLFFTMSIALYSWLSFMGFLLLVHTVRIIAIVTRVMVRCLTRRGTTSSSGINCASI